MGLWWGGRLLLWGRAVRGGTLGGCGRPTVSNSCWSGGDHDLRQSSSSQQRIVFDQHGLGATATRWSASMERGMRTGQLRGGNVTLAHLAWSSGLARAGAKSCRPETGLAAEAGVRVVCTVCLDCEPLSGVCAARSGFNAARRCAAAALRAAGSTTRGLVAVMEDIGDGPGWGSGPGWACAGKGAGTPALAAAASELFLPSPEHRHKVWTEILNDHN